LKHLQKEGFKQTVKNTFLSKAYPNPGKGKNYSLFSARVVTNVFAEVEGGDAEDERVLARLQQLDQHLQDLVVLLVQPDPVVDKRCLFVADDAAK
jgi:hypothetical protein